MVTWRDMPVVASGYMSLALLTYLVYNKVMEDSNLFLEIEDIHRRGFLVAYTHSGEIKKACKAAGIGVTTAYYWRRDDKQFREAFETAGGIYNLGYLNELECELKKRSLDPKAPMSTVALFFALKAEMPDKYREKAPETKLTGDITIKLAWPEREYVQIETIEGEVVNAIEQGKEQSQNEGT